MATAKKLPSGNWRIRVGDGKRGVVKSFVAPTKREAEYMALQYQLSQRTPVCDKTIGECVDAYIDDRRNVLSPTSVMIYEQMRRIQIALIENKKVGDLTQQDVQAFVNELSATLSAKTVHNVYSLLSATISVYRPDFRIRVRLPQVQRQIREYPDAAQIIAAVTGTAIELPVLLALWEGLRLSEVCGVRRSDICDDVLTIRNVRICMNGEIIEKPQTKTVSSTRQLRLPKYILDKIKELPPEQEYLTTMTGRSISNRFTTMMTNAGLPRIRFHDLRHINASIMLALGIPDKYAMERGGWSTTNIMKSVYQHTFSGQRHAADDMVDHYFAGIVDG